MDELIRKSHNVSLLMYHYVFVAKYRRVVVSEEVDILLKGICLEASKRFEIRFLEIGSDDDYVSSVGEHANEEVIREYITRQGMDGNYRELHKSAPLLMQMNLF